MKPCTLPADEFLNAVADLVIAKLDLRRVEEAAARPSRIGLTTAQHEAIRALAEPVCQAVAPTDKTQKVASAHRCAAEAFAEVAAGAEKPH
mgnify:CR=1 FL=1